MTEEQKKLVEDNHGLIYAFIHKYRLQVDDYYDIIAIGLCKAAMSFDEDRGCTFSSYAYACMYNELLCEWRRISCVTRIPESEIIYYQAEIDDGDGDGKSVERLDRIPSHKFDVENDTLTKIGFDKWIRGLSDRERAILEMLLLGYRQEDIGRMLGFTQSCISRILKKMKIKFMLEV